ncbi:hypothetical protein [Paenibacillus lentus]|uniref:Uncharacterized protein n=1 Tax=Paenibacillus lentus TaxID=1338368 RepID=A0A3Q8S954_9BACL|nr:hypothetical protein [Paenibacillus lentus]AZK45332.1 hypothetical protein EIM92_03200 [Paenibacillus lentus]
MWTRRLFPAVPGASSKIVDVQKVPLAMVYADGFINGQTALLVGSRIMRTTPSADDADSGHAWMIVDPTAACHDSI